MSDITRVNLYKEKIRRLVEQLNSEYNPDFIPLYPNVLVYILPKEQRIGSLYLPGSTQNKVTHEGVVLKIWSQPKEVFYEGVTYNDYSSVNIGDHVLFSHYAGQPTSKEASHVANSAEHFRLIPEKEFIGTLSYSKFDIEKELGALMGRKYKKVLMDYLVYPKCSKTLSGK